MIYEMPWCPHDGVELSRDFKLSRDLELSRGLLSSLECCLNLRSMNFFWYLSCGNKSERRQETTLVLQEDNVIVSSRTACTHSLVKGATFFSHHSFCAVCMRAVCVCVCMCTCYQCVYACVHSNYQHECVCTCVSICMHILPVQVCTCMCICLA